MAKLREGQIRILRANNNSEDNESIMKWLDEEVGGGENGIVIYPNLQTFRQIYTKYVKDKLATKEVEEEKEDNNNKSKGNGQLSKPRIILIATLYETTDSVKHSLSAVGVKDIQSFIDNGSLAIVDISLASSLSCYWIIEQWVALLYFIPVNKIGVAVLSNNGCS